MKRVVLLSVIVGVGACTGTASGTHDMPGASNPLVGYVADCGDAPSSFLAEPAIAVYTASQQAALWCLKKLAAPGSGFKVISYPEGTGAPTWIQMEGEVDLGGTNEEAPQSFVTKYGPLVGAVFDVTGDYEFTTKASWNNAWSAGDIFFNVSGYKGVAVEPGWMRIHLSLRPTGFGGLCVETVPPTPCDSWSKVVPGHYTFKDIDGWMPDSIRSLDLDPSINGEEALQAALTACGSHCSFPGKDMGHKDLPAPLLEVVRGDVTAVASRLAWLVRMQCFDECAGAWTCTYKVDALSGKVLGGGKDCCIDCFHDYGQSQPSPDVPAEVPEAWQ
jgi:hypothetical protein